MRTKFIFITLVAAKLCAAQVIETDRYVLPFVLDIPNDTLFTVLPDSLGGNRLSGYGQMEVQINEQGREVDIKLRGLYLVRKSDKQVIIDVDSHDFDLATIFVSFQNLLKNYVAKIPIIRQEQPKGQIELKHVIGSQWIYIFFR
jgi:hypothetical protein